MYSVPAQDTSNREDSTGRIESLMRLSLEIRLSILEDQLGREED